MTPSNESSTLITSVVDRSGGCSYGGRPSRDGSQGGSCGGDCGSRGTP